MAESAHGREGFIDSTAIVTGEVEIEAGKELAQANMGAPTDSGEPKPTVYLENPEASAAVLRSVFGLRPGRKLPTTHIPTDAEAAQLFGGIPKPRLGSADTSASHDQRHAS